MGGGGRDGHRYCFSHKPPVDGGGGIVVRRWRRWRRWRRCRSPLLLFLAATIVARPLARRRATMVDYLEELGATVVGGIFLAATAFQHNKA